MATTNIATLEISRYGEAQSDRKERFAHVIDGEPKALVVGMVLGE